jgi:hypothetical protein
MTGFFSLLKANKRCIVLSDENLVNSSKSYWNKDSDERYDGRFLQNDKTSVIGDDYRTPVGWYKGMRIMLPVSPVTRLHRRMKSDLSIHEVVKLGINVKKGIYDDRINPFITKEKEKRKKFVHELNNKFSELF